MSPARWPAVRDWIDSKPPRVGELTGRSPKRKSSDEGRSLDEHAANGPSAALDLLDFRRWRFGRQRAWTSAVWAHRPFPVSPPAVETRGLAASRAATRMHHPTNFTGSPFPMKRGPEALAERPALELRHEIHAPCA